MDKTPYTRPLPKQTFVVTPQQQNKKSYAQDLMFAVITGPMWRAEL
jgi:hypothetical protein